MKEKNKILGAANFLEELAWLLNSKKGLDLEDVSDTLRNIAISDNQQIEHTNFSKNRSSLVGVLPFLFQDKKLFSTNNDIIDFAESLFKINISRKDKRTKYELIGIVVTETTKANDDKIDAVMRSLAEITNSELKLTELRDSRESNDFSWNEAISKLGKGS